MFFEWAVRKLRKKKVTLRDGSAAVTGLLLALLMPAQIHWLNMIIASFIAIVVIKELMGGLGRNIFNPALFGYVYGYKAFLKQFGIRFNLPHMIFSARYKQRLAI